MRSGRVVPPKGTGRDDSATSNLTIVEMQQDEALIRSLFEDSEIPKDASQFEVFLLAKQLLTGHNITCGPMEVINKYLAEDVPAADVQLARDDHQVAHEETEPSWSEILRTSIKMSGKQGHRAPRAQDELARHHTDSTGLVRTRWPLGCDGAVKCTAGERHRIEQFLAAEQPRPMEEHAPPKDDPAAEFFGFAGLLLGWRVHRN